MADLHDLAAAYALDALDAGERSQFESHLAQCSSCREELAAMEPSVVGLAQGAAIEPPPSLKTSVLEGIARTPQEQAPTYSEPVRLQRRQQVLRRWVAGLGAAAVIVVAVLVSGVLDSQADLEDVLAAPDSSSVVLEGEIGTASFLYADSLDTGFFTALFLPRVAEDETYQLWLIDSSGPTPAGTFRPDGRDGAVVFRVEGDIAAGKTLGMTIEPAGGSPAPTGEVLLAEILG